MDFQNQKYGSVKSGPGYIAVTLLDFNFNKEDSSYESVLLSDEIKKICEHPKYTIINPIINIIEKRIFEPIRIRGMSRQGVNFDRRDDNFVFGNMILFPPEKREINLRVYKYCEIKLESIENTLNILNDWTLLIVKADYFWMITEKVPIPRNIYVSFILCGGKEKNIYFEKSYIKNKNIGKDYKNLHIDPLCNLYSKYMPKDITKMIAGYLGSSFVKSYLISTRQQIQKLKEKELKLNNLRINMDLATAIITSKHKKNIVFLKKFYLTEQIVEFKNNRFLDTHTKKMIDILYSMNKNISLRFGNVCGFDYNRLGFGFKPINKNVPIYFRGENYRGIEYYNENALPDYDKEILDICIKEKFGTQIFMESSGNNDLTYDDEGIVDDIYGRKTGENLLKITCLIITNLK